MTTDAAIAERLLALRARIPQHVTLIAVSKLQPASAIRAAYAAGQRDFGENYVQEWRGKAAALADLVDLRWHLIGSLQANKAKYVASAVSLVHTVDNVKVAKELDRRAAARESGQHLGVDARAVPGPQGTRLVQRVLVQVNVAREASKAGVLSESLAPLLAELRAFPHLEVAGLMTIPPATGDPRPHFRALRALASLHQLRDLSMGMSGDFGSAIEEGATLVRVGTAIFGTRT